jgi:hypothetical protein
MRSGAYNFNMIRASFWWFEISIINASMVKEKLQVSS